MKTLAATLLFLHCAIAQQSDWINNIKNLPVIDIRKYKNSTTTTAGIQEAWDAKGPGFSYLIPAGVYHISSCITVTDTIGKGIVFKGSGYSGSDTVGETLIINDSQTASMFCIDGSNGAGGFTGGKILIQDLKLIGNLNGVSPGNGIECNLCLGLQIDNVTQKSASIGLSCVGCIRARISNSSISTNWLEGVKLAGGGGGGGAYEVVHNVITSNCLANPSTDCGGLTITNSLMAEVHDNDFEGNGSGRSSAFGTASYGTRVVSANAFSYHDNYNERNDTGSLFLDTVKGFNLFSNYFEESGLYVNSASVHGSVHDNYFLALNTLNLPVAVSGAATSGGFCQITTSADHLLQANNMVYLASLGGSGCNGSGVVTAVFTPTVYNTNIPFSGSYTTGGTMMKVSGLSIPLGSDVKVWSNDTSLQAGLGLGTYISGVQLMENLGAAIASATTIAPTNVTHHITGNAAIVNITPPTSQAAGFAGSFCAIPDGAFTTTNAGNIAIASTAVVGKQLCWTYDPTAVKWYPSY